MQYSETTPGTWTFVLSAPAADSYIAMGFSSNGQMVGSSAIVGWMSSTEGGVIRHYYLGGTSPSLVELDKGNLVLTNYSFITTQSATAYMGFQLVTDQPQTKLIYSVGPTGLLPVAPNYRLTEHFDKVATSINYITGQSTSYNVITVLALHFLININYRINYITHPNTCRLYFHTHVSNLCVFIPELSHHCPRDRTHDPSSTNDQCYHHAGLHVTVCC